MNDSVDGETSARNPGSGDIIALAARSRKGALSSGALQPIRTSIEWVVQDGLRFPVKWVDSLGRKAGAAPPAGGDPFSAPEPDLMVAEAGRDHLILLNKFPVLDGHLLVVSRDFVDQSLPLWEADFAAIVPLLRDFGGLAFYNGDRVAGASQRHRHLQWIPRHDEAALPLLAGLESAAGAGSDHCRQWPYRHWIVGIRSILTPGAAQAARRLHDCYVAGRQALGLAGHDASAYNLLLTRTALLLVPRTQESVDGISINALGFAGSLFVSRRERIATVHRLTPFGILESVGRPWQSRSPGQHRPR
ncbi:MAG: phosphorylase [Rhodocyclaceae bacterium]|nr:phosphorylase [Rhodocyclaceae bacterium]